MLYKDQVLTTDSSVQVMATSVALVVWSPTTVTSSLVIATIISSTTMEVEQLTHVAVELSASECSPSPSPIKRNLCDFLSTPTEYGISKHAHF